MRAWVIWSGLLVAILGGVGLFVYRDTEEVVTTEDFPVFEPEDDLAVGPQVATFGNGCYWCTEAVFLQLNGVEKVVSGFSGGSVVNPTYEQISRGTTGHAEVIQITYDPKVISYAELLEVFWRSHDPTTKDRQGHDVGPQYRSVIFTHTPKQRELAERYKRKMDEVKVFSKPIVTEIAEYEAFYPASASHQNYFAKNQRQPYCRSVIQPKVDKMRKVFPEKVKAKS